MSVTVQRTVAELDPLSALNALQHDPNHKSEQMALAPGPAAPPAAPPAAEAGRAGPAAVSGSYAHTPSSVALRRVLSLGSAQVAEGLATRTVSAAGSSTPAATTAAAFPANPAAKAKAQSFSVKPMPVFQHSFVPASTALNSTDDVSFACAVPSTSTKTDERGKMFTVYNIKLSALGTRWVVSKRFSELENLNEALRKRFPNARLPKFPSKGGLGGLFRRLDDVTIEKRRADLQTYLDGALLHHSVYKSMLLRMFFEIPRGIDKANREAAEQAAVRAAARKKRAAAGTEERNPHGRNGSGSSGRRGLSFGGGARPGGVGGEFRGYRGGGENRHGGKSGSGGGGISRASTRPIVLFANQRRQQNKDVVCADFDGIRQAIKDGDLDTVHKILAVSDRLRRYVDPSGQSMLHLACMFSHTEIAMALVEVGADPGLGNSHGETAYDLAPPALAQRLAAYVDSWQDDDSSGSSIEDGGMDEPRGAVRGVDGGKTGGGVEEEEEGES